MGESAGSSGSGSDPQEVANYVAALSRDLAALAKRARLPVLAYFLDMATAEAESCASSVLPSTTMAAITEQRG